MSTTLQQQPIIAGAGPVGLAAGVFLAQQGVCTRIIDAAPLPSPYSRALAVNPRTLELLEPTGVTGRMLERGMRIQDIYLHHDAGVLAHFSLRKLKHRFAFMLALSQAATEELLSDALGVLGGRVERGVRLTACSSSRSAVEASMDTGGQAQNASVPWLLGADGAHSTVRAQAGVEFEGSSFPEPWFLTDVALDTDLQVDAAHIWFFDAGGFVFMLPVVDDIRKPGAQVWRVMGTVENMFERLPVKMAGQPVWQSQFHVAHRIVSAMRKGQLYLAGDAAHIHSPMGARGMNLGIEDAWQFAALHKAGRLEEYGIIRREVDQRVVKRVEMMTKMARGEAAWQRVARRRLVPVLARLPYAFSQLVKTVNGLDHAVG